MKLELDTLKNNDEVNVIYNKVTDVIVGGFFDLKGFKQELFQQWQIREDQIKEHFDYDVLEDFFVEHEVEFDEKELKQLMGGGKKK